MAQADDPLQPDGPVQPKARFAPNVDLEELSPRELRRFAFDMALDGYRNFRSNRSKAVRFWKGWAQFWQKMTEQKQKENEAFITRSCPILAAQLAAQLAAHYRDVAPKQPAPPPDLSLSAIVTISIDPVEAAAPSESELTYKLLADFINSIKISTHNSTEATSPTGLTFSKTPAVSTEPAEPAEPGDTTSRTCRKCSEVLPSQTALIEHLYANCRSPVRTSLCGESGTDSDQR